MPAIISCEKVVDLPMDREGRILVNAVIDDSETKWVYISISQPSNGKKSTTADKVSVRMMVDGKEVKLNADKSSSSSYATSYYTRTKCSPGQKIELSAEAVGLPSVYAESAIPPAISEYISTVNVDLNGDVSDTLSYFRIWLSDAAVPTEYPWGVQILKRKIYELKGDITEDIKQKYESLSGKASVSDIIQAHLYISENEGLSSRYSEMITDLNGGNIKISNQMKYMELPIKKTLRKYKESIQTSYNGTFCYVYENYEYKIRIYSISPELYNYLRSNFIATNSEIPIHLGFSPATYLYTNIHGGLGYFAGATTYETEWTKYE